MSRNEYSVFVAVADSLSYMRAAKILGLHASSVSRIIERLEARLGLSLIEPGPEGMRLTEAGLRMSRFLTPLLDRIDQGVAALCQNETWGGELRIAAPPEILVSWVNPVIRDMLDTYPALSVSLEASVGLPDFRREAFDVFLSHRREAMQEGSYRIRLIGAYAIGLFAAPRLLEERGFRAGLDVSDGRGVPCCPEDIAGWPCLTRPEETLWTLIPDDGASMTVDMTPQSRLAATPAPIRIDFAVAGRGIVAASVDTCQPLVQEGRLVRILPGYRLPEGTIFAALPERHQPRPVVGVFLEQLIRRVRHKARQT